MQKYDMDFIRGLLADLETKTIEIASILGKSGKLEAEEIAELAERYKSRDNILDNIRLWRESPEGKKFIMNNRAAWNKKISIFMENDKLIIENLKERVDETGEKLRHLMKQRSILIYTKGKKS